MARDRDEMEKDPAPTETVEATGSRPATTTSSAAEQRPEQAATAPKEASFTTTPERPVSTLPEGERHEARNPENATAEPARGLEDIVKEEQQDDRATVTAQGDESPESGSSPAP